MLSFETNPTSMKCTEVNPPPTSQGKEAYDSRGFKKLHISTSKKQQKLFLGLI